MVDVVVRHHHQTTPGHRGLPWSSRIRVCRVSSIMLTWTPNGSCLQRRRGQGNASPEASTCSALEARGDKDRRSAPRHKSTGKLTIGARQDCNSFTLGKKSFSYRSIIARVSLSSDDGWRLLPCCSCLCFLFCPQCHGMKFLTLSHCMLGNIYIYIYIYERRKTGAAPGA